MIQISAESAQIEQKARIDLDETETDPGTIQKKSAADDISVRREMGMHKPFDTSTHLATNKTSVMRTLSKYCKPEQLQSVVQRLRTKKVGIKKISCQNWDVVAKKVEETRQRSRTAQPSPTAQSPSPIAQSPSSTSQSPSRSRPRTISQERNHEAAIWLHQSQELNVDHSDKGKIMREKHRAMHEMSLKCLQDNMKLNEQKKRIGFDVKNQKIRSNPKAALIQAQVKRHLMSMSYGCADINDFYHRVFRALDIGKQGVVSVENMVSGLRTHCKVSVSDARTMLAFMDTDDDGKIDFKEFFKFLDITDKDVLTIKIRNVPPTPAEKVAWCRARVEERSDLSFALQTLLDIANQSDSLTLVKTGLVIPLWEFVAAFQNQADTIAEEKTTLDHRQVAVEILEIVSKCFATLTSKRGRHPLPDPNVMVAELHNQTVKVAHEHMNNETEDTVCRIDEAMEDLEGLPLEERVEAMKKQIAIATEEVWSELPRDTCEDSNKGIKHLVDSRLILFLLRCIAAQIHDVRREMWPEVVDYVLLDIGESDSEGILGLADAHRRIARKILACISPKQLQTAVNKHKDGKGYINVTITAAGREELKKKKELSAHNSQWGKMRKSREEEERAKAEKRRQQLKKVEEQRKHTLAACAARSAKRRKAAQLKRQKSEAEKKKRYAMWEKEMKSKQEESERRWSASRRKLKAPMQTKSEKMRAQVDKQLDYLAVSWKGSQSQSFKTGKSKQRSKRSNNRHDHNMSSPDLRSAQKKSKSKVQIRTKSTSALPILTNLDTGVINSVEF